MPLWAQINATITVEWKPLQKYSYAEKSRDIPNFEGVAFTYDYNENKLEAIKLFQNSGFVEENALQISNLMTEIVQETDLGELDKSKIAEKFTATVKNSLARNDQNVVFVFEPFFKLNNEYHKVVSFNVTAPKISVGNKLLSAQASVNAIQNSVLANGSWYRFYVEKSGVYYIDKSFLKSLGFNTGVDPRKIKIFGNGGRMLPILNSVSYPMDLAENAIEFIGESDGSFDDGDYILMYCEGMDNWSAENETHLNLYSDKSYYYVTYDGSDGKRIQNTIQPIGAATTTTSEYNGYYFHEVDKYNIGKIGKVWFGEEFYLEPEQDFTFDIPNLVANSSARLDLHVGDVTFVNTKFNVAVNGGTATDVTLQHISGSTTLNIAHAYYSTNFPATNSVNVKLTYDNSGVPTAKGYLDFIKINTVNTLTGFGQQYRFQKNNLPSSGIIEYQFSNASNINRVWDITDIYNVNAMVSGNNQSNFSFKDNLGTQKKYIAVDGNNLYAPLKEKSTQVSNQNLKGTVFLDNTFYFEDIDYLIITPSLLSGPANKLATFHRNYSGLNVKVVYLENIYQEFGGGKQDIGAIRNFIKYVYQNASTAARRVKYVNLFGDASYDFKNRIRNNTNIVPIFHALNSYTDGDVVSFCTDDFFVMLDNTDPNPQNGVSGIDVAIGRMIVSSETQAYEMVNKVIEYHDIKSYGNWRTNAVFIADDADKANDGSLQAAQNSNSDNLYNLNKYINYKKVLLDSYQQETTSGGARYPKARTDIRNAFEKGALVFNFIGHGGETGLTQERVWDRYDGYDFYNQYKYPLFITITCEFSRFDNPSMPTAGEYTYWNAKGGALSMLTTTRKIGYEFAFNSKITEKVFSIGETDRVTMGEALRITKNLFSNSGANKVVSLIGDPAVYLAYPQPNVVLTKINDVPITQPVDDLKALNYVKLSGQVQDETGNLLSSYNGDLAVQIFDKDYIATTLNNDGYATPMNFTNLGETVFRGNATVVNGQFEFGFVVPKDIKIPVGNGRISFYAKRNQTRLDKIGYNTDIRIGGINLNAVADTTPPLVNLYMNDETFVSGGITSQSPYFLVKLSDEHGINTASGIGHDLVAILDGDENNPYILNDYYETEPNNYTLGKIRYPFRNLSLGKHTILFRGWDVYNNLVTAQIEFIVVGDDDVTLSNVLNYPNPFVNYTEFWFSHNKPYENLDVQVQIFTITGKIVKTINQKVSTDGFTSRGITWNGLDDFGDKIGKGVYVYKLTVKSELTGKKAEKTEKLVIL